MKGSANFEICRPMLTIIKETLFDPSSHNPGSCMVLEVQDFVWDGGLGEGYTFEIKRG